MVEEEDTGTDSLDDSTEKIEETQEDVEAVEEGEGIGREYALAMAPVVRMMREELDNDKIIRSRVKREMNLWLEKICRKVTTKINESEYTVVELDDFKTAIEPYEMIDDVEQERRRIIATLEKIKQDCDSLIRDVSRKFITYDAVDMDISEPQDISGSQDISELDDADDADDVAAVGQED